MGIKVVKFGGSSLASADQFKKVSEIIKSDVSRQYVIASAPGKRFSDDEKVTDLLYSCYKSINNEGEFNKIFEQITERYNLIIKGLNLDLDLTKEYEIIKQGLKNKSGRDYAASRGEYLNSIILAEYLGFDFINAADVIYFDERGFYDNETTMDLLSKRLKKHKYAVIPGFYGSMPNDTIKTFSRGGSDVTGSIVASAAKAEIYENWTDVSGFLVTDPRIVENPKQIELITYRELRELSYMGATVLHEDAIFPVRNAHIPINIKNTNCPSDDGTFIVSDRKVFEPSSIITGIAGKKGLSVISIEKDMMNNELGFGRKVLQVLEQNNISFEHLPSGIDTMCVIVPSSQIEKKKLEILNQMKNTVNPDTIEISDGLALIAVVGKGMIKAKGTAAKVFKAISEAEINIKMIDQGSGELNIIIGVDEKDFEKSIKVIYAAFF